MQDRKPTLDENLLQRAAGPYIGVNRVTLTVGRPLPVYLDQRTSSASVGMFSNVANGRHHEVAN